MSSYVFRKDGPKKFSVTKWDGSNTPKAIYHITIGRADIIYCSCPAGYAGRSCKHLRMLIEWLQAGMPEMKEYDE